MGTWIQNGVRSQIGALHDPQILCPVPHPLSGSMQPPVFEHHLVCLRRFAPPPRQRTHMGGCTHTRGCKTPTQLILFGVMGCYAGALAASSTNTPVPALVCIANCCGIAHALGGPSVSPFESLCATAETTIRASILSAIWCSASSVLFIACVR